MSLRWWWYPEAGTYAGPDLKIDDDGAGRVRVSVLVDAQASQTIHLILEAVDDGVPTLTGDARVVLVVTSV